MASEITTLPLVMAMLDSRLWQLAQNCPSDKASQEFIGMCIEDFTAGRNFVGNVPNLGASNMSAGRVL